MTRKPLLLFVTVLTLVLSTTVAFAQGKGPDKGNKPIKKMVKLQPTMVEPNANGFAKIMLKTKGNAMQSFMVIGANLKMGTVYRLFVNNVEIMSDTADIEMGDDDEGAAVQFKFSKKEKGGNGNTLPANLDPVTNIKLVELRDPAGMIVLSGQFSQ